ncbi:metallophosphoesterase family protein [Sphingomonas glaciei]|uniref:Metallophosphoesterase n=1 Tax=Sphingomonas glaciei TaxID=2938948 RepID=A0ABY5MTV0_9SPHN|nr:metallophosphoesterase [Sphingomonas glaciei]UUR07140.1 metallophosphoesterase [Sphingomonas glaciei]
MNDERTFRWLHLSDLHVGMKEQSSLWPNVKSALLADLQSLLKRTGTIDVIIFSGDMTNRGKPDEFAILQNILTEIRDVAKLYGPSPQFLFVPGNHDLQRPRKSAAPHLVLKRWWDEPAAQEQFWEPRSDLQRAVTKSFLHYSNWTASGSALHSLSTHSRGILPGDFSGSWQGPGIKVGIVGLNSTWLQLDAGDYEKKLHVDLRQILAVTNHAPEEWCAKNDINLIVTHHPPSWLHPSSLATWESEINPPGRFDVHFFGHMHVPDAQTILQSGSTGRTTVQAASAFGLESLGNGQSRVHGFNVGEIRLDKTKKYRRIWPRVLKRHTSGRMRFVADTDFELNEGNYFEEQYGSAPDRQHALDSLPATLATKKISPGEGTSAEELEAVRYKLLPATSHRNVRLPEQEACIGYLKTTRTAWIQADWGLGSDGFVWSVLQRRGHLEGTVYRFDCSNYESRDRFLDGVRRLAGISFEKLCEVISRQSNAYILFDNVNPTCTDENGHSIAYDIAELMLVVNDYCPEASVLVRSRGAPPAEIPSVRLRALDEPDIAVYVSDSPYSAQALKSPDFPSKLHRLTDGTPSRLDRALRELNVVGISDLVAYNSDYVPALTTQSSAPATLVQAITVLSQSDDIAEQRALSLLQVLSTFPQGEELEGIRRFNVTYQFFATSATLLHDQGLIDSNSLSEVSGKTSGRDVRVLSVARDVRDYIRATIGDESAERLHNRAMELYFGSDWRNGLLKTKSGHRYDEPLQFEFRISNASALLLRHIASLQSSGDDIAIRSSFRLLTTYLGSLVEGAHYRSVVALSSDLEPFVSMASAVERDLIAYQNAKSLRMLGEGERAREVLEGINSALLTKDLRRSTLLNLALCYQSLDDPRAVSTAEKVISMGKAESSAVQAEAIIIRSAYTGDERRKRLLDLENTAKRKKFDQMVNTIALIRADDMSLDEVQRTQILDEVLDRSRNKKDFYNGVRALIKICAAKIAKGEYLTERDRSHLIDAYHFLYNERLSALFEECSDTLWADFERTGDVGNLLRLFRHSSFIWRLLGREQKEKGYIKRLAKRAPKLGVSVELERERAYYLARASATIASNDELPRKIER